MFKLSQLSFRGILLSGFLFLTIPVLLVGEYVTYKKARSSLLETARLNLRESAVRKASIIETWLEALQSNLITASEGSVFESQKPEELKIFLKKLAERLPAEVKCLQLTDWRTKRIIASNCGKQTILSEPLKLWPQQRQNILLDKNSIYVNYLWPQDQSKETQTLNQVSLVFNVPVYVKGPKAKQLRYVLSCESNLPLQTEDQPMSLSGYTVIFDHDRRILSHPSPDRVGKNISEEADAVRLENLIKSAISGRQDFLHLFSFEKNGVELLAGYAAIPSPVSSGKNGKWVVAAITRLDYALNGLKEIQQVLFILIFGLIAASVIAAFFIAGYLASPIEKLRDYALSVQGSESDIEMPQKLKIYEFNQLLDALNGMVKRLQARARELEIAGKEARVANRLKSEILRTVSHELRTPLNGIIGSIQFLQDDMCDNEEEEQEFLQTAYDSALHLLSLIDDILDVAVIESGKISMLLEQLDVHSILQEAIDLQTPDIQQKKLALIWEPVTEKVFVQADSDKLKQVFLYILNNAVKFTDKGSISVMTKVINNAHKYEELPADIDEEDWQAITYQLKTRSAQEILIKITDTGIGIDPKLQEQLFQPFVKADGSTTCRYEGLGLGLSISRHLLDLMQGKIDIYSDGLGKGTTVTIALPIISNG